MKFETFIEVAQVQALLDKQGYAIGKVDPKAYHSWKEELENCVSKSSICEYMKSPYAYHFARKHGLKKESAAMSAGSLVDCLCLTPELFDSQYCTEEINRRTNEGKARAAEIKAAGLTCVKPEEVTEAKLIADNASIVLDYLANSKGFATQVAMWVRLERVGVRTLEVPLTVCGMIDALPMSVSSPIVDLKTTSVDMTSTYLLSKNIVDFDYGVQAAMYRDLYALCTGEQREFAFLFAGSKAPYFARVVTMSDELVDHYQWRYQKALYEFSVALRFDKWGNHWLDDMEFKLPEWKKGGE